MHNIAPKPVIEIPIKCSSSRIVLFALAAGYLIFVGTEFGFDFLQPENLSLNSFKVILLLLAPLLYILSRPGLFRRGRLDPLRFYPEHFCTPIKIGRRSCKLIPYSDIVGIDTRGAGRQAFHIVQSRKNLIYYPQSSFFSLQEWQALPLILMEKIAALPDGFERRQQLQTQREVSKRVFRGFPKATLCLLLLQLAVFLYSLLSKQLEVQHLAGLGANSAILIKQGQYFRLISSGFLHSGFLHFSLNAIGLLGLGYLLEKIISGRRFLIIFFAGLVGGSLLSAANGSVLSVGSSSGIFGLFGAMASLNIRYFNQLPAGIKFPLRWWSLILAVNLALPLLFPQIDIYAHFGGMVLGFTAAEILCREKNLLSLSTSGGSALTAVFSLTLFTSAVSLITAIYFYLEPAKRDQSNLKVMQVLVKAEAVHPILLNKFAWEIAIAPQQSEQMLKIAEQAALKGLKQRDNQSAGANIRDTLATILFRMGRFSEAIALEHKLLLEAEDEDFANFTASQLSRFLQTYKKLHGLYTEQPGLTGEFKVKNEDPVAVAGFWLNEPPRAPLLCYALLRTKSPPNLLIGFTVSGQLTEMLLSPEVLPEKGNPDLELLAVFEYPRNKGLNLPPYQSFEMQQEVETFAGYGE